MSKSYLFQSAVELLESVLAGTLPADARMEQFFRAHPRLGARDRGFVAETVYACLRRRRSLGALATGTDNLETSAAMLVASWLVSRQGWSGRALSEAGFQGDSTALLERLRNSDPQSLPAAVRADLPDWLFTRLVAEFGDAETHALSAALNEPATLDLRVNTLKATRDEAQACLQDAGFAAEPTPYSPVGLRRRERVPLFKTPCFEQGMIEVQDEGSQLLSLLLEPKRGEMVMDFCAGAGGKTLHLAALLTNTGSLYAMDVSAKRLERLKPRLKRAGAHNVRSVAIASEHDPRVQRLGGKFDRVLVDAPCSGTGTLRRNPDIKWRPINLDTLVAQQRAILAAAAALLKSGGRLVYATCSLLREENDDVIQDFLVGHTDFSMLPAGEILKRRQVPLTLDQDTLHLLPHRHHTDGFFAAVLERR